ncbi:MAG TPA: PAS domain-containing protein [Dongiaceae bacterium]|nr:PAS domain-containing protein [Dongiaceae bacterium]
MTTDQPTQPNTRITAEGSDTQLRDAWPHLHPLAELRPAITDARLRAMLDHWLAARGNAAMPAWKDIDPLQLGPLLPHIWSLRYDRADDSFTGRLSGEEVNAIFGKSLRQTRMEDFFAPADVPWIHERCLRIIATPCIALVSGPVYGYTGRYGRGSRIMLPLGEDRATGDEVIGATVYRMHPPGTAISELLAVEQVTYYAL